MWSKGVIGIPNKEGEGYTPCRYCVKYYDEGSKWGINGGRISKLEIRVDGKITANYDRGWDIEPQDEPSQLALSILLDSMN